MLSTEHIKLQISDPMRVFTFIHKEYTAEQHLEELAKMEDRRYIAITSGVQKWDLEKQLKLYKVQTGLINVDIANVYANVDGIVNTQNIENYSPH